MTYHTTNDHAKFVIRMQELLAENSRVSGGGQKLVSVREIVSLLKSPIGITFTAGHPPFRRAVIKKFSNIVNTQRDILSILHYGPHDLIYEIHEVLHMLKH
jgi:hypothetical protein